MLESYHTSQEMKYEKLSAEEQEKRGILGRLIGPIADYAHETRNGRLYSEKLWEKFFNDPLTQEKIKEKVFVGELGHPADRTEVDMEKIAICLAEMPKKGDDGNIYGVFDILNTPNGKILKTLCDYGSHIGVSSRGTGDVYDDFDGREKVDEDTFECECWDAVLVPAVKQARLQYVNESLNKKSLKKALQESLEKSSEEDRKVMTETLHNLHLDINDPEKDNDINEAQKEETQKTESTGDNVMVDTVKELQESLLENSALKEQIIALQEKLSVCYTKETSLTEELTKYKSALAIVSDSKKNLDSQIKSLKEDLARKNDRIKTL